MFTITINDTNPIWLYCSQTQGSHCQAGMAMVINPPYVLFTPTFFRLLPRLNCHYLKEKGTTPSARINLPLVIRGRVYLLRPLKGALLVGMFLLDQYRLLRLLLHRHRLRVRPGMRLQVH
jgi:hypothetical protein